MVPIIKGGASGSNGKGARARPIDRGWHGRRKDFLPIKINGTLVRGDGKDNMYPFPCRHVDDTAIIPAFTPAGAHVEFYPLFGGTSFTEQTEALIAIHGVVPYDNDTCPVRAWVHLVPKGTTELRGHQSFRGIVEIGVRGPYIGLLSHLAVIGKTRGSHWIAGFAAHKIDIIPIKWQVKGFPGKVRNIGIGRIDHNLYIALGQDPVKHSEFVQSACVVAMVPVIKGGASRTNDHFVTARPVNGCGQGTFQGFRPIDINNGFGLGYGNSNMNPLPGGHIDDTAIVPAFTPTGAHIEFY